MKIAQSEKYQGDDSVGLGGLDRGRARGARFRSSRSPIRCTPTFRNPTRVVTDRASKFRLETEGWGTFRTDARVDVGDGTPHKLTHDLELHYPDGTVTAA